MTNSTQLDDDDSLDPAAMLALVQREQDGIPRRLARRIPWILLAWGVTWLLGYGMLWLIDGARPAFSVPLPVAVAAFVILMLAAIAVSVVIGVGAGRGIRSSPASAFTGTVFGVTCSAAFLSIYVFAIGLSRNGMPPTLEPIFFSTGMGIMVGLIYLMSGAIWHAVPAIVMGGALLVVALVAPFFGYPNNYVVLAIGGGATFLCGAVSTALYVRGDHKVVGATG